MRLSALQSFPRGSGLVIVASNPGAYRELVGELADPAVLLTAFDDDAPPAHPALEHTPHVLLEGLDDVERPAELLLALHGRAVQARLFALVANAAHLRALTAFVAGTPLARVHPLVHDELRPLFDQAGWPPLAVTPVLDPLLRKPAAFPDHVDAGFASVRVDDEAAFERGQTAAYMVVADRR